MSSDSPQSRRRHLRASLASRRYLWADRRPTHCCIGLPELVSNGGDADAQSFFDGLDKSSGNKSTPIFMNSNSASFPDGSWLSTRSMALALNTFERFSQEKSSLRSGCRMKQCWPMDLFAPLQCRRTIETDLCQMNGQR